LASSEDLNLPQQGSCGRRSPSSRKLEHKVSVLWPFPPLKAAGAEGLLGLSPLAKGIAVSVCLFSSVCGDLEAGLPLLRMHVRWLLHRHKGQESYVGHLGRSPLEVVLKVRPL
jgi:hypothetical protein